MDGSANKARRKRANSRIRRIEGLLEARRAGARKASGADADVPGSVNGASDADLGPAAPQATPRAALAVPVAGAAPPRRDGAAAAVNAAVVRPSAGGEAGVNPPALASLSPPAPDSGAAAPAASATAPPDDVLHYEALAKGLYAAKKFQDAAEAYNASADLCLFAATEGVKVRSRRPGVSREYLSRLVSNCGASLLMCGRYRECEQKCKFAGSLLDKGIDDPNAPAVILQKCKVHLRRAKALLKQGKHAAAAKFASRAFSNAKARMLPPGFRLRRGFFGGADAADHGWTAPSEKEAAALTKLSGLCSDFMADLRAVDMDRWRVNCLMKHECELEDVLLHDPSRSGVVAYDLGRAGKGSACGAPFDDPSDDGDDDDGEGNSPRDWDVTRDMETYGSDSELMDDLGFTSSEKARARNRGGPPECPGRRWQRARALGILRELADRTPLSKDVLATQLYLHHKGCDPTAAIAAAFRCEAVFAEDGKRLCAPEESRRRLSDDLRRRKNLGFSSGFLSAKKTRARRADAAIGGSAASAGGSDGSAVDGASRVLSFLVEGELYSSARHFLSAILNAEDDDGGRTWRSAAKLPSGGTSGEALIERLLGGLLDLADSEARGARSLALWAEQEIKHLRMASKLKQDADTLYRNNKIGSAIRLYGAAVRLEAKRSCSSRRALAVLYGNRAACFAVDSSWESVVKDCDAATLADDSYKKVLLRKARALMRLERYAPSVEAFQQYLAGANLDEAAASDVRRSLQMAKNKALQEQHEERARENMRRRKERERRQRQRQHHFHRSGSYGHYGFGGDEDDFFPRGFNDGFHGSHRGHGGTGYGRRHSMPAGGGAEDGEDLYGTLGVSKSASQAEIRKAYHRLALKLHPDKNGGDAAASDRFRKVSSAYETLRDKDKREEYDMRASFGGGFGGGYGGRRRLRRRLRRGLRRRGLWLGMRASGTGYGRRQDVVDVSDSIQSRRAQPAEIPYGNCVAPREQ